MQLCSYQACFALQLVAWTVDCSADLLQRIQPLKTDRIPYDLFIFKTVGSIASNFDGLSCGCQPHKFPLMCAAKNPARHHHVPLSHQILDLFPTIWKWIIAACQDPSDALLH